MILARSVGIGAIHQTVIPCATGVSTNVAPTITATVIQVALSATAKVG